MREKELRLAIVCYGGISLAVYMHGITKEIWRLARASRAFESGEPAARGSQGVYRALLEKLAEVSDVRMSVIPDILTGASAGGINAIFLAQALQTGQSLEPLTELWLKDADVDELLDPEAKPGGRLTKVWATPLAWAVANRPGNPVDATVSEGAREEVRDKLSRFIRARWFAPPFGGPQFTGMILNALEAMANSPVDPPLMPEDHPLDLFVTVTDFHGHPERLRLHSPSEVVETEHRLILSFSNRARGDAQLGHIAELAFAARATASFPGAFPPFSARELDAVLAEREQVWPGRDAFLARALPRHAAAGIAEDAILIDGSVLANAPFGPAINALRGRPARRPVDRRFLYIEPKPNLPGIRLSTQREERENHAVPGFFRTILGALSDIPREQPIRDNLDAIAARTARIGRMRAIIEGMRPDVEAQVDALFGRTFFLDRPSPARLARWRATAQGAAASGAGYAYAAYGHLKLSNIVENAADILSRIGGDGSGSDRERFADALWRTMRDEGLDRIASAKEGGASPAAIAFFRTHDLAFRLRRLRFMGRRLADAIAHDPDTPREAITGMHDMIYDALARYTDKEGHEGLRSRLKEVARHTVRDPQAAIAALGDARDLRSLDEAVEEKLAEALAALPKAPRRMLLLAYLGFPFYDIATLPLLQGEGLDEYDPVLVDRIAPDDAGSIRAGGAEATLKGIEFNSFGAFFSRAYRENDYLWGRLHGAERLIDILVSTLPPGTTLGPGALSSFKRDAFRTILLEEEPQLTAVSELIASLHEEIG